MDTILYGTLASFLAGIATGLGGLIVLLPVFIIRKVYGWMLGFCAGVMLAATAFSLIMPGLEFAINQGAEKYQAAIIMVIGMLIGWRLLSSTHKYLPVEKYFKKNSDLNKVNIWLFVVAITIHNFPEGMAVGVSFANHNMLDGISVAFGIGLQNIPEGLAVALALITLGYSRKFSLIISVCTGLVEPIGGLLGASIVSVSQLLLPWGMAFAAGAMLTVISEELIPESHKKSQKVGEATMGIMFGFLLMMFLDIVFG